jgi:hypothetical protein
MTILTNYHGYVPLVVNTSRSFPRSRLITGFVARLTRRLPLVEQELITLLKHPSSPPVFSGVRLTRSLVLYVCFVDRCLSFCTFFWAIVLSVFLRYTDSDCSFGIFKLFWQQWRNVNAITLTFTYPVKVESTKLDNNMCILLPLLVDY